MRCPKEEGNDQGDDCGLDSHKAQAQAPPSIDLPYHPGLFSSSCFVLDYLVIVIPSAKVSYLHALIN
jgi:hypothetical protein